MDPYFWTWAARWGGACVLAAVWSAGAVVALSRGRRFDAVVLAVLAVVSAAALGTHAVPLLTGGLVPEEPTALAVAAGAPFVAFTALATRRPRENPVGVDLASILPTALFAGGWPAWAFAGVVIGRRLTFPGAARRALLVGVGLLALASAVDAQHARIRHALPLPIDDAVRVTALAASAPETVGWLAITAFAARPEQPGRRVHG
jgi:hypothetical protein